MNDFVEEIVNTVLQGFKWANKKEGHLYFRQVELPNGALVIRIWPAPLEIVGGRADGQLTWVTFQFPLKSVSDIFDKLHDLSLNSVKGNQPGFLRVSGWIKGQKVRIEINTEPSDDIDAQAYIDDVENFVVRQKIHEEEERREINEETGLYEED